MDLTKLIKPQILKQGGYHAESASCMIKLDANESPFTLSHQLKEKLFEIMKTTALNRYPEPGALAIRERFADYYGVNKDMIMVGNGSDELIHILCSALSASSSVVMTPYPTFVMYKIIGSNSGCEVIETPLDASYELDIEAMLDQIAVNSPGIIFISYPNSPTGNCFEERRLEAIIQKSPGIVVIDEAYGDFARKTMLPLLKKYDNLVILKTLSKVGLAAMRIGFLIGASSVVRELDKVRLPYNVNSLSQIAADFFIDNNRFFLRQVDEVIERREELYKKLMTIERIRPFASKANFILFRCDFDSDYLHEELIKRGIMIKNMNKMEILKNCMRVTVGSRDENDQFIYALKDTISKL